MSNGKLAMAKAIAQVILWGFNKHYRIFRETAQHAKQRFEDADWQGVQQAARERIRFYDTRVLETVTRLGREFGADERERDAALVTFLVTASGLTLLNIGGAFWGLVFGLIVLKARTER